MNKTQIVWIVIILITTWGGYRLLSSNDNPQHSITTEKQNKTSETPNAEMRTHELAQRYGAITGWENKIVYTIHAQEILLNDSPVLFQGYLDDIFNRDGKTYVRFMSSHSSTVDYVLELECDRLIVDKFINGSTDENDSSIKYFDEFAVIAKINEVSKPAFSLEGTAYAEDNIEIEIDSSTNFIVAGTCLDIVKIGNLFDE
jgi:hypothetical protein